MPRRREGPTKHKISKIWFFDEYIGFAPNKKRVRFSLRTKDPLKAEWLWEQEYKRLWREYYGMESPERPQRVYFVDMITEFVNFERDIKRVREWQTQENRLKRTSALWGDITLDEIKREHLVGLDRYLRSLKRSEATINHYMTLLKSLFNYAIREKKFAGDNPINEIRPYPTDEKRREYSPEELKIILEVAGDLEAESAGRKVQLQKYIQRVVLLLLYTGMRLGEVVNLRWENVKEDKIVIPRTETKGRKKKVIPITAGIRIILEDLRSKGGENPHVIPIILSKGGREDVYTKDLLDAFRERTGIEDFDFHTLRHTASTIMVSQALGRGVGPKDIMEILGHSRLETTMKYLHSDFDRKKLALEILEEKTKG